MLSCTPACTFMPRPSPRWDIFCAVVDNYGDAAIAWRLARMLVSEHAIPVRLYIDAPATLALLQPGIDAMRDAQSVEGVEVRAWGGPQAAFPETEPGGTVIEAFGCGLPGAYLEAMAARARQPVWILLEYLSAERWIEDCHGLASPHPTLPLTRYFFFPGFTPASGGLLRERDLVARRDRFRADAGATSALWRALGVAAPDAQGAAVSLFCYPGAPVADVLDAWVEGDRPVFCAFAQGVATSALERWAGGAAPGPGHRLVRGALTLAGMPFLSQADYDRLLWACDINFVRGEDSFVRAQWAARPLVWNVYPQAEDAHRLKLDAFLDRYCSGLPDEARSVLQRFSRAWNGDGNVRETWRRLAGILPALTSHAGTWSAELARQRDLATALVNFRQDRL